jgi:hypothetical protein
MKTCEFAGDTFSELRSHPWLGSITDPGARYHDLRESPQLIRSALEDFVPWARYGAIESFYALVERLNHRRSAFESNDCAFTGPHLNDEPSVDKALSCTGRLMLLFHALAQNVAAAPLVLLKDALHEELSTIDAGFQWGMVGTTLVPTRYLGLPERDDQQMGAQLMISFWAWGDSEADTMLNLGRLFTNLGRALRTLSARAAA